MQRTITLPANGTYPLRVEASVLAILSATASFQVQTDRDGVRTMASDRKLGSVGGPKFKRITFIETGGADNTITFYVGDQEYVANTLANTGSVNAAIVPGLTSIGAPFVKLNATPGTPVAIAAASKPFRKAKLIAQQDLDGLGPATPNAGNIALGGGSAVVANQGMLLAPGDEIVIEAPVGERWDFNQLYFDVASAGDGLAVVLWSA